MHIDKFKKIVIKIGSSILVDEKGKAKKIWLKEFAKDIKNLINKKKQVVLVSSGSIALGCNQLNLKKATSSEFDKKGLPIIGLINEWTKDGRKIKLQGTIANTGRYRIGRDGRSVSCSQRLGLLPSAELPTRNYLFRR